MKLGRVVFAVALCLSASPHGALAADDSFRIYGYGATSCTKFVTEASQDVNLLRAYYSWAQGYMSHMNGEMKALKGADVDLDPKGFDANKQIAALGDYCTTNGGNHFVDAVDALYEYLATLSAPTT